MRLGDNFPDFAAETNQGHMDSFHRWIGEDSWAILFSHPADFTPVCTTELARAAQLASDFALRGVKLAALSCDSAESHRQWTKDIAAYANKNASDGEANIDPDPNFPFPIIADQDRRLATRLGMLDPLNTDSAGLPFTVRAVFVIDPKKRLRLSFLYPASTGRNFDEILRVVDSLQLTDRRMVATPEGWKPGSSCMIEPKVDDGKAAELFGTDAVHHLELPSGKGYLRMVEPK